MRTADLLAAHRRLVQAIPYKCPEPLHALSLVVWLGLRSGHAPVVGAPLTRGMRCEEAARGWLARVVENGREVYRLIEAGEARWQEHEERAAILMAAEIAWLEFRLCQYLALLRNCPQRERISDYTTPRGPVAHD